MHNLHNQAFPMRHAKNLAKPYAFTALQEQIQTCCKCKDCKKCTKFPHTLWGNYNATLLIILSWPSVAEDELSYLQNVLDYYHVDPDILAFTCAVHCNTYTDHMQRPAFREEVCLCAEYTRQAIDIIEPLAILCLSTVSSNLFYKQSLSESIKEPSFIQNIPIFTTYPPSHILNLYRSGNVAYEAKQDLFYANIKQTLDYIETNYPTVALYKED